jgi:hypothetical protein
MNSPKVNNPTYTTIIPDPWDSSLEITPEIPAKIWQFPQELHPLISGGANIAALPQNNSSLVTIQLLLEDWLKLKTKVAQQLTTDLTTAIGLLYVNQLIPNHS